MESLLAQSYRNLEILIVDDCSTDDSVEILRKYEDHPAVKLVLRQQNAGVVAVMNQGIELCSGEFVIFAQCDDDCDEQMIEQLVGALQAHASAGAAFCRSLLVDENDAVLGDDFRIREQSFRERCRADTLLSGAEMGRFLMYSCVMPNMSAVLFRKACFAEIGPISVSYRVCCDWELYFRLVKRFDVAYVAAPLNRFRQHETTVRSVTKERVVLGEYIRLLLGQMRMPALTILDRVRFRTRVMSLWAGVLLSRSKSGLPSFPHHLGLVVRQDPLALLFLGPALILRAVELLQRPFKDRG